MDSSNKKAIGILLLRLLIGVIFLMQGYGKIFQFGIDGVYQSAFASYETILPTFLLKFTAYFTSYAELIGGLFLIFGLFRTYVLIALSTVLVIVSFGHGLIQSIWDLQHVVFRALLLFPLFFLPDGWDTLNIDRFIKK